MLSLGLTMEETGVSSYIASSVTSVSLGLLEGSMQMLLALVILYLITSILTELLSNAATIVIMAPISLELAHSLNLCANDARAASASFITPIGYQTNTFVYTVGGYKFADFAKIGIFFNLIYFTGTITLVCYFWGFGM